tara:strand:- start:428 stop:634 length:207 start_codon:yes stop_codon:yes gene_type:complete
MNQSFKVKVILGECNKLRDKQADRYDRDRLISVGDTNEDKLRNSLHLQAYNQGYRQAIEDLKNKIMYR